MEDDLNGKINELLSDPESMARIQKLAGMLTSGGTSVGKTNEDHSETRRDESSDVLQKNADKISGMPEIDAATLMRMKDAFQIMRGNDPRIDFLVALKPIIGEKRRNRIDDAIRMLRLMKLMPFIQKQGFLR